METKVILAVFFCLALWEFNANAQIPGPSIPTPGAVPATGAGLPLPGVGVPATGAGLRLPGVGVPAAPVTFDIRNYGAAAGKDIAEVNAISYHYVLCLYAI